jgi:hypothetical protein
VEYWLNLRLGGARRWKGETGGWEGRGVVCGKPTPSRLYPPPVSIKDRWIGPREQVLNVPIACWWYGSSTPTASMIGLGEKLGTNPRISHLACWGLCWEPLFSGAVESVQIYHRLMKGCHALITWDIYGLGPYADWAWDACGVLVRFSHVGCILIRIIVTLRYEYRLFVAVIM